MSIQVTRRSQFLSPDLVSFDWLCNDDELRPIAFDSKLVRVSEDDDTVELTLSNITGHPTAVAELKKMIRQLDAQDAAIMVNVAQACAADPITASREGWDYLAEVLLDVAREQAKVNLLDWTIETVCFQASVLA